jgi:hypothetical protein
VGRRGKNVNLGAVKSDGLKLNRVLKILPIAITIS